MRRSLLAALAAWGAAGMTLQVFPVAWGWAQLLLSFAFLAPCSWLARSLARSLPSPTPRISQDSWCKATFAESWPWIRCNQEPGHVGPHAYILPTWTDTPGAGR